jgi:hypothetical protein
VQVIDDTFTFLNERERHFERVGKMGKSRRERLDRRARVDETRSLLRRLLDRSEELHLLACSSECEIDPVAFSSALGYVNAATQYAELQHLEMGPHGLPILVGPSETDKELFAAALCISAKSPCGIVTSDHHIVELLRATKGLLNFTGFQGCAELLENLDRNPIRVYCMDIQRKEKVEWEKSSKYVLG